MSDKLKDALWFWPDLVAGLENNNISDIAQFTEEIYEVRDILKSMETPKSEVVVDLTAQRAMKEANQTLAAIIPLMDDVRQKVANEDPTITLGVTQDEYDSKNIFLRKAVSDKLSDVYDIVGLHAIGHAGPYEYTLDDNSKISHIKTNFMALETWGNEYDDEHNMLGRGSFRLHTSDIEQYAKDMEAEGWERYEGPKKK